MRLDHGRENGIAPHAEMLTGAIRHLTAAMENGSPRACAVACMLFSSLAQDEGLGEELCEVCRELGECLERMSCADRRGAAT